MKVRAMSPNELQFLRQDIKELLKKVDMLSNRVDLIESDHNNPRIEPDLVETSKLCTCGSIPEEYCTCKLW